VLEVVGAGVAEVVTMTTAVGMSEVAGGVMLVAGFGLWTGWKGSPWSLRWWGAWSMALRGSAIAEVEPETDRRKRRCSWWSFIACAV